MTLQTLNTVMPWPQLSPRIEGSPGLATEQTLDATGEYFAAIFCAREAMTISHVGWRTGTVAGSPTVDTRIETVGADGLRTGVLFGTDTNIVSGTLVSSTWTLHALTGAASITAGQVFAVVVVYASGTSIIVQGTSNYWDNILNLPYRETNTSGAPVKSGPSLGPLFAFGSSTTTFYHVPASMPLVASTNTAFNNTNDSARGLRFQIPFKCRCAGVRTWNSSSVGDFAYALYDDAGSELSSSSTVIEGDQSGIGLGGINYLYFDNKVTLSPGTWYRVAIVPNSATNTTINIVTLPSADYRSAMPTGTNANYTVRTSGVWDDSTTTMLPWLDILIDQLDDGAVAAGHGNMTGGLQ